MRQFWNNFWIGFDKGLDVLWSMIPFFYTTLLLFEAILFYYKDQHFESMVMTAMAMIYIQVRKL
jgi:hypothetical protein